MASVTLNAAAALQAGWFDKDVAKKLTVAPASQRDSAALAMNTAAIKGLGPGCENALATAISKPAPTVHDFLAFMPNPTAGTQLAAAMQQNRSGGGIVGMMYKAYQVYAGALTGV